MVERSKSLSMYFTAQHREADDLWPAIEAAASKRNQTEVLAALERFARSIRLHLRGEEEVLFPEIEQATGMIDGPTRVMRAEHQQMRALLDQMFTAARGGDLTDTIDAGATLMTMIGQHNMKEERMLYRVGEQALGDHWPALLARVEAIHSSAG